MDDRSDGSAAPPAPARFTFAELFSGVGGFRLGLEAHASVEHTLDVAGRSCPSG